MSGRAIDVPGRSMGNIGEIGNAKQEIGKVVPGVANAISGVLAVEEKVSVVVCR